MNKKVAGASRRRLGRGPDALVLSVISALVGNAHAQARAESPPGPIAAPATTTTPADSAAAPRAANAPVVPTVTVSGCRSSLGLSAARLGRSYTLSLRTAF